MEQKTSKGKLIQKFINAASSNSGRVHIVPGKDGWSVKKEGSTRSMLVFASKRRAVIAAKEIASSEQIVIHRLDGAIAKRSSTSFALVAVEDVTLSRLENTREKLRVRFARSKRKRRVETYKRHRILKNVNRIKSTNH